MNNFLKPEAISGFPEWLPEERILEQNILDTIRDNFEKVWICADRNERR